MAGNYDCSFNLNECIKTLGLEERGKVQTAVTQSFMDLADDYVPFDLAGKYENPGRLRDSVHVEDGTDVVYSTPYARNLYYHDEYRFQGAPMRGAYWADRMLQNGGLKEIEEIARKVAGT